MQKILDLLEIFKTRAVDPALQGHTSYTRECFELAAKELDIAIRESEPANLVAFIPPGVLELVNEALHFNPDTEECWQALGQAAVDIQSGPS